MLTAFAEQHPPTLPAKVAPICLPKTSGLAAGTLSQNLAAGR